MLLSPASPPSQRAIEAQVEERRQQREREEARRREEEEEEERRVALEREMLQKQYELDTLRERQKVRSNTHTYTLFILKLFSTISDDIFCHCNI